MRPLLIAGLLLTLAVAPVAAQSNRVTTYLLADGSACLFVRGATTSIADARATTPRSTSIW